MIYQPVGWNAINLLANAKKTTDLVHSSKRKSAITVQGLAVHGACWPERVFHESRSASDGEGVGSRSGHLQYSTAVARTVVADLLFNMVKILIACSSDPNSRTETGSCPIVTAVATKNWDLMVFLVS